MSGRRGSNSRPLAWKANALSTELLPQKQTASERFLMSSSDVCNPDRFIISGKRWIRTTEGVRQQIYSLPHLATLVSSQFLLLQLDLPRLQVREPMEGFEPTTPRLQITCSGQLSYIGIQPLRDAKVGIFFIFANFLSIFFQMNQLFCFRALLSLVQRTEIIRFVYQSRKIECKYNDSFPN